MRTSIIRPLLALGAALAALLSYAGAAAQDTPADLSARMPSVEDLNLQQDSLVVLPFVHLVPKAGKGMASILASELAASGRCTVFGPELGIDAVEADKPAWRRLSLGAPGSGLEAGHFAAGGDYLLAGSLDVIDIADKDVKLDLGHEFRDLSSRINGGNRIAQVRMTLHLYRCSDGLELWSGEAEGLESQRGLRRDHSSIGWLASLDFNADEFRQTQLGRAAYKAVGAALRELYTALPLQARVLAVTPGAVVINLDEASGLQVGDELAVFGINELQNSQGMAVWTSERRVGGVQIVQFQPGRALCLILDGQDNIMEGDIARPLNEPLLLPLETDK